MVTHHHLGFECSRGFEHNAYNNEYGSTAHCDIEARHSNTGQNRQYSDNAEEKRTHERDL